MRVTDIDPSLYEEQLAKKQHALTTRFAHLQPPELEVFSSPSLHYRMRAEFRVWHDGDDLYHIMFDKETKEKYRVDHFPAASQIINNVMQDVLAHIRSNDTIRRKLFQIDYLSTLSDEILVTLVYHRQLDDNWEAAVKALKETLSEKYKIDFVGRARKQKITLSRDYVIESLPINGRPYYFKQIENSFTQPNAVVNCKMIEWALDATKHNSGDLLELYCGLGNFSLPMAVNFDKVLATEISKASVNAAQFNIEKNQIGNVKILRMSSEEFVEASKGEREFKRLEGTELSTYQCNTVLVDPPRAGLDPDTVKMVSEYDNIVYISCNPDTLLENLETLTQTHTITRFALFDQFPYTHHAECGVYLQKR
ncbi:tRNA (uridine(54)-C5)-methyltransferase TrmA [Aestuariibacter sp. AA17]|uniref:tRNA/tmRNA (uracil-C(5))-methyltransferase n=1 Tax=Fluctibacter corallii TaxID=2984329 RepID=A0ABT3AD77_9ALTE|nr:tRNA (uridine(54)-C5)-methyltransferase TrmA [Aestuariibacter sp. AA17]MCV2886626.1 tRNA (uridine(54)-C5)-methyltransferase TrmA [Aestuariibacter sp. AA17]